MQSSACLLRRRRQSNDYTNSLSLFCEKLEMAFPLCCVCWASMLMTSHSVQMYAGITFQPTCPVDASGNFIDDVTDFAGQ